MKQMKNASVKIQLSKDEMKLVKKKSTVNERILENAIRNTFKIVERFICWGQDILKWICKGKKNQRIRIEINVSKANSIMQLIWANDCYIINRDNNWNCYIWFSHSNHW